MTDTIANSCGGEAPALKDEMRAGASLLFGFE